MRFYAGTKLLVGSMCVALFDAGAFLTRSISLGHDRRTDFLDRRGLWSALLHKWGTVTFLQRRLKRHISEFGAPETVSTSARYSDSS